VHDVPALANRILIAGRSVAGSCTALGLDGARITDSAEAGAQP
jgi:hypothetical protein